MAIVMIVLVGSFGALMAIRAFSVQVKTAPILATKIHAPLSNDFFIARPPLSPDFFNTLGFYLRYHHF